MTTNWRAPVYWVVGELGWMFAVAAVFAGLLQMPRSLYLLPYSVLMGLFAYAFFRYSRVDLRGLLRHNWHWGLLGALLVGLFVVRNVLSQPVSTHASGLNLAFDLVWSGLVYGLLDALLLSVIPVLAVWQLFGSLGWTQSIPGKILAGVCALAVSLLVTAAYHLGYPEFRGATLAAPVFGNGVMSLGYLLTGNPLAAVFSHIAMHVAAVLHGPGTTAQLPPHY